ncbi:MAG: protease-4, partial [Neptuniibacter pectenicola]
DKLVDYTPKQQPWKQIVDELGVSFTKAISTQLGLSQGVQLR